MEAVAPAMVQLLGMGSKCLGRCGTQHPHRGVWVACDVAEAEETPQSLGNSSQRRNQNVGLVVFEGRHESASDGQVFLGCRWGLRSVLPWIMCSSPSQKSGRLDCAYLSGPNMALTTIDEESIFRRLDVFALDDEIVQL